MRRIVILIAALLACAACLAQPYKPKPGETVLRMSIDKLGDVYILLHIKEAPKTTAHILDLVSKRFYDGQKFFKVVKEPRPFLVQVGDPASKTKEMDDPSLGTGGSGVTVPFEDTGFPNVEGAVGLSNRGKGDRNSGDSQFYILLGPSRFLDGDYTVFGMVVRGMDIVKKISLGDKVTSITVLRG